MFVPGLHGHRYLGGLDAGIAGFLLSRVGPANQPGRSSFSRIVADGISCALHTIDHRAIAVWISTGRPTQRHSSKSTDHNGRLDARDGASGLLPGWNQIGYCGDWWLECSLSDCISERGKFSGWAAGGSSGGDASMLQPKELPDLVAGIESDRKLVIYGSYSWCCSNNRSLDVVPGCLGDFRMLSGCDSNVLRRHRHHSIVWLSVGAAVTGVT